MLQTTGGILLVTLVVGTGGFAFLLYPTSACVPCAVCRVLPTVTLQCLRVSRTHLLILKSSDAQVSYM